MKIAACIAVLALCAFAPTTLLASEQDPGLRAASSAPMTLAQAETPCQRKCTANHQVCKAQKRNNCYTIMQACWNACRRR